MSESSRFRWERGLLGAAGTGILSFALFLASGFFLPIAPIAQAVALVFVVGGLAWWAYRRDQREIALGLLAGYAVLSLISGGQCTMLVEGRFEGTPNVLTGFYGYPLLLAAYLIVSLIVSAIDRTRQRKEGHE